MMKIIFCVFVFNTKALLWKWVIHKSRKILRMNDTINIFLKRSECIASSCDSPSNLSN